MNLSIYNNDAWKAVAELEDESIGALVTDPPYLISFMGNDWDKLDENIAGNTDFWKLVMSKMKHGAHGVVFGHSRTHHRVMIALEDAGFEIRDTMMWMYGSGFPKNHNIGKSVDKLQGNKREVLGKGPHTNIHSFGNEDAYTGTETRPDITKGQSKWEGWGTALKPAYEPIILVRKPLAKKLTIAKNCLEHGVGGLNIDESRVGTTEDFSNIKPRTMMANQGSVKAEGFTGHDAADSLKEAQEKLQNLGRWPANVILSHHEDCECVGTQEEEYAINKLDGGASHFGQQVRPDYTPEKQTIVNEVYKCVDDCPVRLLNEQAPSTGSAFKAKRKKDTTGGSGNSWTNGGKDTGEDNGHYDELGGAARFFYQAKASKKERHLGTDNENTHPTVKPVSLMHYLVRLITPEGETVLDPFMGSGATGIACALLDRDFVGVDMDEKWCKVSEARITFCRDNVEKAKKVCKIK